MFGKPGSMVAFVVARRLTTGLWVPNILWRWKVGNTSHGQVPSWPVEITVEDTSDEISAPDPKKTETL